MKVRSVRRQELARLVRATATRGFEPNPASGVAVVNADGVRADLTSPQPCVVEPLRVVYIDHAAVPSGGELALLRLVRNLPQVQAHVILAEDGPLVGLLRESHISVEVLPMHGPTRRLRKDRVRATRLPLRAMSDTFAYSLRLNWRLRRLHPHLVHTNSLKSGVYGSLAARMAGVPVVWHVRDRIDADYLPRLGVVLVRGLTRYLADLVISNSAATSQTLSRRQGSVVIASMVEPIAAGPEREASEGCLVAGMIGRLAPWKGQDVFLRAFAQAFPTGKQRAVIVGAPLFGKEEEVYEEGLHQLAADLGIANRVDFRGHKDDIGVELRAIDVLVHASRTPEPFGQVVVEGLSAGLSVVATRGGGPEEIITDGTDGLLYASGDVATLAQILQRLDSEPDLRLRLGRAASSRAGDFSSAVIADQVMRAYRVAVSNRQSSRWSRLSLGRARDYRTL